VVDVPELVVLGVDEVVVLGVLEVVVDGVLGVPVVVEELPPVVQFGVANGPPPVVLADVVPVLCSIWSQYG
jgi:hypothetical protein